MQIFTSLVYILSQMTGTKLKAGGDSGADLDTEMAGTVATEIIGGTTTTGDTNPDITTTTTITTLRTIQFQVTVATATTMLPVVGGIGVPGRPEVLMLQDR